MELERPYCTIEQPESDEEAFVDANEYLEQAAIEGPGPSAPPVRPRISAPQLTAPTSQLVITDEAMASTDDEMEVTDAQRKRRIDYQRRHALPAPKDPESWHESLRPRSLIKSPRMCDCCNKSEEECRRKDTKGKRKMSVKLLVEHDTNVFRKANVLPRGTTATATARAISENLPGNSRTGRPALTYEGLTQNLQSAAAESASNTLVASRKLAQKENERKRVTGAQPPQSTQEDDFSLAKVAKQQEKDDALLRREENKALRGRKMPRPGNKGVEGESSTSSSLEQLTGMAKHYMGKKLLQALHKVLKY